MKTVRILHLLGVVCLAFARSQVGYEYCATNKTVDEEAQFNWNITITNFMDIIGEISPGVFQLQTNYTLDDRPYDVQLYKNDCLTPPTPNFPIIFDTAKNNNSYVNSTEGNNFADLFFIYNQTVIQESDIWRANKTGGDVEFCLVFSNYLSSSSDPNDSDYDPYHIPINNIDIIYRIEVDELTDFEMAISIFRKGVIKADVKYINYEDEIEAYQCDDSFVKLLPSPLIAQGQFINVCTETVFGSAFSVHSIKDVDVAQSGRITPPSRISYQYVTNYVDTSIAESSCQNSNTTDAVCKTKMQVLGFYFDDAEPTSLYVSGVVKLDYLGRRLIDVPVTVQIGDSMKETRALEEGTQPSSSYAILVKLVKVDEDQMKSDSSFLSLGNSISLLMLFIAVSSLFILS